MLSDSPPERDLEWTETGVVSSYKFINKIWDLFEKSKTYKTDLKKTDKNSLKKFDKIINEISNNIESFQFNKSVAKIYEYVNLLSSLMGEENISEDELREAIKNLTIIIHPFIPHISEEIWEKTNNSGLCATANWPKTKKIIVLETFKMPIQINGKTRSLIDVNKDDDKNLILERVMKDNKIIKNIENKEVVKTIFVKDKIVNLVVK